MIDADLAALDRVPTQQLNGQVRRNARRFPGDFGFRRTAAESSQSVANRDHRARRARSSPLPRAFTEQRAIIAANVRNSPRAVAPNVHVVRAFVRLREVLASHGALVGRVDGRAARYGGRFRVACDAMRGPMAPPGTKPQPRIGCV